MALAAKHTANSSRKSLGLSLITWIIVCVLLIGVPLFALLLTEGDHTFYWELPPRTLYVSHAPFSWAGWAFYMTAGAALLAIVLWTVRLEIRIPRPPGIASLFGLGFLLFAWALAWNRWGWAEPLQHHTFLVLWISYIAFLNALLFDLHGSSPLTDTPRGYLLSFPISGLFWWVFEYLNRYTQNWHYVNVHEFSPVFYASLASLSFCTVLPAIWVTHQLVFRTFLIPRVATSELSLRLPAPDVLIVACILMLALIPLTPNYLFAGLWGVPLLLAAALGSRNDSRTFYLASMSSWALAGLWCGFFWELWNYYSLAKWAYFVPFAQRFHLFEMPIAGYGGYLPFGVLCGMVIESLQRRNLQGENFGGEDH